MSLAGANAVYQCAVSARVTWGSVQHSDFERFSLQLRSIETALGDVASDETWRTLLGMLKSCRWKLTAAPIPFGHPTTHGPDIQQHIREAAGRCAQHFPEHEERIDCLLVAYDELGTYLSGENPLLDCARQWLVESVDKADRVGFVLANPRLLPLVDAANESSATGHAVELLTAGSLRHEPRWQALVLFGSASWFPNYAYLAPRAPILHIVGYEWALQVPRVVGPGRGTTDGSSDTFGVPTLRWVRNHVESFSDGAGGDVLAPGELLPSVDVQRATSRATDLEAEGAVEARLFTFTNGDAVWLGSAEGSRVTVIDTDADNPRLLVRSVSLDDVVPGNFIVLRMAGASDYVHELADQLLGADAVELRHQQREWKERLRRRVDSVGSGQACRELSRRGCAVASESNIRHWMSQSAIMPQKVADYEAVLSYVGLSIPASTYVASMRQIRRAHLTAGQRIRKMILAGVEQRLEALRAGGLVRLQLDEEQAGSLAAYEVAEAPPGTYVVRENDTGTPFHLDTSVPMGP